MDMENCRNSPVTSESAAEMSVDTRALAAACGAVVEVAT